MNTLPGRDVPLVARALEVAPAAAAAIVLLVGFWIVFRSTRGTLRRGLERAGLAPDAGAHARRPGLPHDHHRLRPGHGRRSGRRQRRRGAGRHRRRRLGDRVRRRPGSPACPGSTRHRPRASTTNNLVVVTVRRRGPGRERWRSDAKARGGLRMPAGRGEPLFVARACVLLPGHRVQPSTGGRRLHEALEELSDGANEQVHAAPAPPPNARSFYRPRNCVFHFSILPPGILAAPWPQARRAPIT